MVFPWALYCLFSRTKLIKYHKGPYPDPLVGQCNNTVRKYEDLGIHLGPETDCSSGANKFLDFSCFSILHRSCFFASPGICVEPRDPAFNLIFIYLWIFIHGNRASGVSIVCFSAIGCLVFIVLIYYTTECNCNKHFNFRVVIM